jgi:hypothetical protein
MVFVVFHVSTSQNKIQACAILLLYTAQAPYSREKYLIFMKNEKIIVKQRRKRKIRIAIIAVLLSLVGIALFLWIFTSLGIYLGDVAKNI